MTSTFRHKLLEFYKNRKDFLYPKLKENEIEWVDVFDPYVLEKRDNPIVIIGEAPGKKEVELKSPFVGDAGRNLDYLISISGLNRKRDFLITNAFPFRTYKGSKNRTPKASELKLGAILLKKELEIINPSLILLLGNSSIKAYSYLDKLVLNYKKCGFYGKIGVCFHPSPIAFNRKEIRECLENFFRSL